MHNATAITTGSANQRPNTPCIRLWIDVTFRGLEDSYRGYKILLHYINMKPFPVHPYGFSLPRLLIK